MQHTHICLSVCLSVYNTTKIKLAISLSMGRTWKEVEGCYLREAAGRIGSRENDSILFQINVFLKCPSVFHNACSNL